jgi:hypothetical protein
MFTLSYQEQRAYQEKLQAEAERERALNNLPRESARKVRGLWKVIGSFVF